MLHRILLQNLGCMMLCLYQVLLEPLSHAIPGSVDLLDLFELILIAIENRQGLRVIEQLEVNLLYLFLDFTLRGFIAMLGELSVFFRLRPLQTELAGTGDILRDAEAGVIKVAAFISREWLRTSNREVLDRHLWIGQRRRLNRHPGFSLPRTPPRAHDGPATTGLIDQPPHPISVHATLGRDR